MTVPQAKLPVRQGQIGISLVVTLLLLLTLTLIGIAALNNNNLQVKMAVNDAESNLSFQSAESATLLAEKWLSSQTTRPAALGDICTSACSTVAPVWKDGTYDPATTYLTSSWWNGADTPSRDYVTNYADPATVVLTSTRGGSSWARVYQTPRYFIEELVNPYKETGSGASNQLWYYRITALGYGSQQQSATMVQSIYAKRF